MIGKKNGAMISAQNKQKQKANADMALTTYFRQLERRFRWGLVLAFLLPLAALSAYFHFQFHLSLKETGRLNLAAIAESQRNTVDLFLQERLVNIFALFYSSAFSLTPTSEDMERLLSQLRRSSDAVVDVGFLSEDGIQVGYAGPFSFLQNRDYSHQDWFVRLMSPGQDHHISDIYLGFRNKLHFTIAAKQMVDQRAYILKATIDPDKFYLFLKTINHAKGVESILINRKGEYQLFEPWSKAPARKSNYIPPDEETSGARIIDQSENELLVAHAWLSEVPWALLVSVPLNMAYAKFYHARRVVLLSSSLFLAIIVAGIWVVTHKVIQKAKDNAEKKEALSSQLMHASKLASLGELATGVAHEINNPLAIIVATSDVIKDMLTPEFQIEWTPDQILDELSTIRSAVFRAKGITQQLLDYGRKSEPRMVRSDLHSILENVLGGFKERSLALSDISVLRDFDRTLPNIMVDPNQIQQVFFNLINNAGDAIGGSGKITITTRQDGGAVRISITDTGSGMDSETMKKIFDPFYTTKEIGRGTGLGLSVSIGIVESMGGRIEVQSMPGAGSTFTVVLPRTSESQLEREASAA